MKIHNTHSLTTMTPTAKAPWHTAYAIPFTSIAALTVLRNQAGGLKGRQGVDNVIEIEAAALTAFKQCLWGMAIFSDFIIAFPKLARP